MAGSIRVTPSRLQNAANQVEGKNAEYVREYKNLLQEVRSLSSMWKGEGNEAYVNQINGFEEEFENLKKVFEQYATFLREAAKVYAETEDSIKQGARKLASGR